LATHLSLRHSPPTPLPMEGSLTYYRMLACYASSEPEAGVKSSSVGGVSSCGIALYLEGKREMSRGQIGQGEVKRNQRMAVGSLPRGKHPGKETWRVSNTDWAGPFHSAEAVEMNSEKTDKKRFIVQALAGPSNGVW